MLFNPEVVAALLLERANRRNSGRRRNSSAEADLDELLDGLYALVATDPGVRRALEAVRRRRRLDLPTYGRARRRLVAALIRLGRSESSNLPDEVARVVGDLLDHEEFLSAGIRPIYGSAPTAGAGSPSWQEALRDLDAALAAGGLSANEYRLRRDEVLADASEQDPAPSPAAAEQGPDTTQVVSPPAWDPLGAAPFAWELPEPAEPGFDDWSNPSKPPQTGPPPGGDERFLVAALPARAPLKADLSLVVRICADRPAWSAAAPFSFSAMAGADVSVLVQAPPGLVPLGRLEQVLSVPPDGDSDPLRFPFRAQVPGLHRVRVMAFAGGTFLAEVEVEVSVEPDGPSVDGRPVTATIDTITARRGEVTLQVRSEGSGTVFQLLSDACLFEPVLAQASAGDPTAAVERAIDTLRQLAQGRGPYSGGTARRWMQETGIGLWQAAVPALIKEQYWQLRDAITSFTIATSHDVIPWELLYPLRPGADDGFLVEQFPVLRRVFDQRRAQRLGLAPCTYVLSAREPENARREIDALDTILGAGAVVEDLDRLLDVIAAGSDGALHFVCHNSFDAGGSSIAMSGGPFVPGLLNSAATRRTLAAHSPLVFINACRTAGSVPEYGRMIGWAQQFMAAGAGAFIGTLWPVRSDSSRTFAEACYARLRAGEPFGGAVLEARRAAGTGDPDPTWLAYTAYGDPNACVPN